MKAFGFLLSLFFATNLSADDGALVVARVNGVAITAGDVDFAALQQGISDSDRSEAEPKLVDRLIDRQLIRAFLARRKIEPVSDDLEIQIAKAEAAIKKQGEDPKKLLTKIGYTPERMKSELGLTLAWQVHVRKTVTPEQMKEYYNQHRIEFDGTQLRARQIFLKSSKPIADQDIAEKREKLAQIRQQIVSKKISFADAAAKYSEAPTRSQGGDIGLFSWQGKLPAAVSQAAFALEVDEISEPIASPFGLHLIQVTEKHPGDFSLEDVRPISLDRLSQVLWKETVETERQKAKIERNLLK